MKTELSKEESAHLISLGVPKEKASRTETIKYGQVIAKDSLGNSLSTIGEYVPIFTLTDLISILPKEIEGRYVNHSLCMNYSCDMPEIDSDVWLAYYDDLNDLEPKYSKELIDALYKLACWCLTSKYMKL